MNRTRTAVLAAAAALLSIAGCTAIPLDPTVAERWAGDWAGRAPDGRRMEARIESVREDRVVTGAGCWMATTGWINGMRFERAESPVRMNRNGTAIVFTAGTVDLRIRLRDDDTICDCTTGADAHAPHGSTPTRPS